MVIKTIKITRGLLYMPKEEAIQVEGTIIFQEKCVCIL
jgi:hypothetical protein